jgi:Arabinose-binding domain of AraC transcription regulator, N-term
LLTDLIEQLPLPDINQRVYGAHKIAAIIAELSEQGIDATAALEGTGLTAPELASHKTRTSYQQLQDVVRSALRLSNDPTIALRAGQRVHVTAYGMYGYALLSSATFAECREFVGRYNRASGQTPHCHQAQDIPQGPTADSRGFSGLGWSVRRCHF